MLEMPSVRLGESLLSSPRQLAGDQGTINMPEQAIEMEELASPSTEDTPRGTLRKVRPCDMWVRTAECAPPARKLTHVSCVCSTNSVQRLSSA